MRFREEDLHLIDRLCAEALAAEPTRRERLVKIGSGFRPEIEREVLSLVGMAEDLPDGFLESPAVLPDQSLCDQDHRDDALPPPVLPLDVQHGQCVYRLISHLGRGTFGEVFLATQLAPVSRPVALKLLRPGLGSRAVSRRFELEGEMLARMSHPGIARVFDAGIVWVQGLRRPYLAMELVEGCAIDEHCRRNASSLRDRVSLVARVCDGLHHAHARGIIHRDLKPTNVLVHRVDGEDLPKLIDFGIAKKVSNEANQAPAPENGAPYTLPGEVIGTHDYMSPEQIDGKVALIDSRTDIYSIGVVLYELLTGVRPWSTGTLTLAAASRLVQSGPPPRPSSRLAESDWRGGRGTIVPLKRELDWVVLKCLEIDPDRRYGSAAELAADLRRFLSGDVVSARPPTMWYQLTSLARRHQGAAWGAAATVAALAVSAGVSTWLAVEARRAELIADKAATEAKRYAEGLENATRFLRRQATNLDPASAGRAVRRAIHRHAEWGLSTTPDEHGSESATFNVVLESINFTDIAKELFEELQVAPLLDPENTTLIGEPLVECIVLQQAAEMYHKHGQSDKAVELQERVVALRRSLHADPHPELNSAVQWLATFRWKQGAHDEACALFGEAYRSSVLLRGPGHPATLRYLGNHAHLLDICGRSEEARAAHRQTLDGLATVFERVPMESDHVRTLVPLLYVPKRRVEGERMVRDAVERHRQAAGETHPATIMLKHRFARLLEHEKKLTEALRWFEDAAASSTTHFGAGSVQTATAHADTGDVLVKLRRWRDAEVHLSQALEILKREIGTIDDSTLRVLDDFSVCLLQSGQFDRAEPHLLEAIRVAGQLRGAESRTVSRYSRLLGECLLVQGKSGEGHRHLLAASQSSGASGGDDAGLSDTLRWLHGRALSAEGQFADAEAELTGAELAFRRVRKRDTLKRELHRLCLIDLAGLYQQRAIRESDPALAERAARCAAASTAEETEVDRMLGDLFPRERAGASYSEPRQ